LGPLRGQALRVVTLWKGSDLQKCPGTYEEVLTNIKIAIFKENYPEDKLTKDDQDHPLEELESVFCGTLKGELPHVRVLQAGGRCTRVCVH
jgi:hypothetical protein